MLKDKVKPSSIVGIKRLANQIKKSEGMSHAEALEQAAKAAKFENYAHAHRVLAGLKRGNGHPLFLTIYWYDRDTYKAGRETLEISLSKPVLDLCSKAELRMVRGLGGTRLVASDHLVSDNLAHSQGFAREQICKAVRGLRFMEATGLRPDDAREGRYPAGDHDNKLPHSDHVSEWRDPENGQIILVDEPYTPAVVSEEREAWAKQHNWQLRAAKWPGMYFPYKCAMFVATDGNGRYDFEGLMARIDRLPAPLIEEDWTGESVQGHEVFISPMAKTPQDKRRARSKGTIISQPSKMTAPYGAFMIGEKRKPRASMPVLMHQEVGGMIKAVLQSRHKPYSVNRRLDHVRSTLEDWMNNEIGPNVLNGSEFFDVYYHEVEADQPFVQQARSTSGVINLLESIKTRLEEHYPDCAPLRRLTGRINTAIAYALRYQQG